MPAPPPLLRGPALAPYFHPFFLIFQIPPPSEVIKIYFPPPPSTLKEGGYELGGRCLNNVERLKNSCREVRERKKKLSDVPIKKLPEPKLFLQILDVEIKLPSFLHWVSWRLVQSSFLDHRSLTATSKPYSVGSSKFIGTKSKKYQNNYHSKTRSLAHD